MASALLSGQRTQLSREEAIEHYILLRLRVEDIKRLGYLVESLYNGAIQLPSDAPFTSADLKDTARTAFFGWFATLTDKDDRAVYAFDPLLVLFPQRRVQIINVQLECEACHGVLQQFRNNVAFHSRAEVTAQIEVRRALQGDDARVDLTFARKNFTRLMEDLTLAELIAIPELPKMLAEFRLSRHLAFANLPSVEKVQ